MSPSPLDLAAPAAVTHAPGTRLLGHPRGLYVLFFTEMWERFSFYGMRSLLILYMVQALDYDTATAGTIYGIYTGMVFLTPIVGGLLADRVLGQRWSILIGGLLMSAGHFAMAFPSMSAFVLALALLVIGNGFFKPNISVIVGQLYAQDDPRRDSAFSIFYVGINLGALLSPLICGTLGQKLGWHYGFAAAGVGMLIGLVIYLAGQRTLGEVGRRPRHRPIDRRPPPSPLTRVDVERLMVLGVLGVFGNIVFWAAFEQAGGSLNLFAASATDLRVPGTDFMMESTWFQAANPLFITLLAPLLALLWQRLAHRQREPNTPLKFAFGLFFLAAGFMVMVAAGARHEACGQVSMFYLLGAYFLNTCGELCCSPVGLAAVAKLAPPRYASLVMGIWFASMAMGNLLAGVFTGQYETMHMAKFFFVPVLACGGAGVVLLLLVRPLRRAMHGVH